MKKEFFVYIFSLLRALLRRKTTVVLEKNMIFLYSFYFITKISSPHYSNMIYDSI